MTVLEPEIALAPRRPLRFSIPRAVAIAAIPAVFVVVGLVIRYFAYAASVDYPSLADFPDGLCRWDCSWYVYIAEHGYHPFPTPNMSAGGNWAFFPLAPILVGAVRLLTEARRSPFTLMAFEVFTDRCAARVERHRHLTPPFDRKATHYVLVEVEHADERPLEAWLSSLFERGVVDDGVQAQSAAQAKELWSLRESISESLAATGLPHKNDVGLPIAALPAFCAELDQVFAERYPGFAEYAEKTAGIRTIPVLALTRAA